MRVIIAGSRHFDDALLLDRLIRGSGFNVTSVVCGMARGADTCGRRWAIHKDKPVFEFPADWDRHGKAAGPIRNQQMAEFGEALILVWDGESRGSASMKRCAKARGLPIYEYITTPD